MATVFMFPGQGSQSLGMGDGLFERYPDMVAEADALLGYSIRELCLKNPDGMRNRTDYTQPALYIVDVLSCLAKVEDDTSLGSMVPLLIKGISWLKNLDNSYFFKGTSGFSL